MEFHESIRGNLSFFVVVVVVVTNFDDISHDQ
jgi:hypothetical protein